MPSQAAPPRFAQQVIRYALLAGVVMFGVVIAVLRSMGAIGDMGFDPNSSPVAIALSVAVIATGGLVPLIHRRIGAADTEAKRFQLTVVALALGEAAAFIGGVLWLLTGSWTMYAVGTGIFLVAMIWLSPDTSAGEST